MQYSAPSATAGQGKQLVTYPGTPNERRFVFFDHIEIGRYQESRQHPPGILLLDDPTISSQHCIITQASDGRCFIRDVSRNGTRLDGKRLIPNVEIAIEVGQSISIGNGHQFILAGEFPSRHETATFDESSSTVSRPETSIVTVLVGDIRDYTALVQRADLKKVQEAIRRVFYMLENAVSRLGGTVKEFRGDAIFAFWEKGQSANHAVSACSAALELDSLVKGLAQDQSVWDIPCFPLLMDWALATGHVTIATTGDDRPTGLSVIGRPVVLAFRLEKFADERTGSIVVCETTRGEASGSFEFNDLGYKRSKGFDETNRVFALMSQKQPIGPPDNSS